MSDWKVLGNDQEEVEGSKECIHWHSTDSSSVGTEWHPVFDRIPNLPICQVRKGYVWMFSLF